MQKNRVNILNMQTGKSKLIKTFVSKFNSSIELPDWSKISLINTGRMRFYDGFIGVFSKDGLEQYKLTQKETSEIKQRITDISKTELYKKNKLEYEKFEERRKEIGVTDELLDKLYIGGYELWFTDIKTKEYTGITNAGSKYRIAKRIVSAIDKGELDIKNIHFSISLDTMRLLN